MSTHFRKKEIRGKNDFLLVLQRGTGRDLLVDTGNVWVSHRLLIRVMCGESPPVDMVICGESPPVDRVICGESPPVDRVICGESPSVDTGNLW